MNIFPVFSKQKIKFEALSSKNVAKDRLELILLAERMQSSPEMMAQMKREIQEVIQKYLNVDYTRMNIQIDLTNEIKQGVEHVKTIQIKRL